jgi:hypothetical protein
MGRLLGLLVALVMVVAVTVDIIGFRVEPAAEISDDETVDLTVDKDKLNQDKASAA